MSQKLENKIKRLERRLKQAEGNGAFVSLSGTCGECILHCGLRPDKAAHLAMTLYGFLEIQKQEGLKQRSREVQ